MHRTIKAFNVSRGSGKDFYGGSETLKILFAIFPIFLYIKPLSVLIINTKKYTSPGIIKNIADFVTSRQCINNVLILNGKS